MEIKIGNIARTKRDPPHKKYKTTDYARVVRKNRRKRKQDRRKSVRDGIFVSLSYKDDRRRQKDRRIKNPDYNLRNA